MANELINPANLPLDGLGWEPDLPATSGDGDGPRVQRTMQGDSILKYKDTTWSAGGVPYYQRELIVYGKGHAVVRWSDEQRLIYSEQLLPGMPSPNITEMNARVPVAEWRVAFGKRQPPYEIQRCLEFLDPASMERLSWPHNVKVVGSSIACEQLDRKIAIVRRLHGQDLCPVVRLDRTPMPTREYGVRQRPDLPVVKWARLTDHGIEYVDISAPEHAPKQLPPKPAVVTQTISEPTRSQEMDGDSVPF
jgi:hypothetical protein